MSSADERWTERYRAASVSLPMWARDAPERCIYSSNATGVWQVYAWDRARGEHRQVTDRSHGTTIVGIDPAGKHVWWFADTHGDESGVWMRQPFGGGPDAVAVPGLAPSRRGGLALGTGLAVIGRAGSDGVTVHLCRDGEEPVAVYRHTGVAFVRALSQEDTLIAITHSEHGDMKHPSVRVLDRCGRTVGALHDGPGKGLRPIGFAPVPDDHRLLLTHERYGRPEPLIWNPVTGDERELDLDLSGDLLPGWYDAGSLLITRSFHARDELFRYELTSGATTRIDTPPGSIRGARSRPDATTWFHWSSFASPPQIRSTDGGIVLAPRGPSAPGSVPLGDTWVPGVGGAVHALVARPAGAGPFPTVVEVHGGPMHPSVDAFNPEAAAWVDHGYAVVFVNYRGSDGYGSAWRDALHERIGFIETEDIGAVRLWMIDTGLADPDRLVIAGGSWGGYLTLFGLGVRPQDWAAGVASMPIASFPDAWDDEPRVLKDAHACLFGGTPTEVPDRYRTSSPLTYVDNVRAPVRCPIRQIEIYVEQLRQLGKTHEIHRFDAGHGSYITEQRITQHRARLEFVRKHLAEPH